MIVDYRSDRIFPITRGTLQWYPILELKWAKSADSSSFVALAFLNGIEYRNSDFKRFTCNDLVTLCKHMVNFGPATPEFKTVKGVRPLADRQIGYAVPVLDLAGISTEFSGAISTQFCFSYSLGTSLRCRAVYTLGSATHF